VRYADQHRTFIGLYTLGVYLLNQSLRKSRHFAAVLSPQANPPFRITQRRELQAEAPRSCREWPSISFVQKWNPEAAYV